MHLLYPKIINRSKNIYGDCAILTSSTNNRTMSKERFKLIPAVHLILENDGKILLLRRCKTGYEDGNYSLIAGHIDGDEPARQAMSREAYEEGGITIDTNDLRLAVTMHFHSHTEGKDNERFNFFFVADVWKEEPTIREPDKCDDLSWFPINKLPDNVVPYVRAALESYRKGIGYVEFGW